MPQVNDSWQFKLVSTLSLRARERAPGALASGRGISGEAEAERPLRGDKAECTRLAEVRGYLI